MKKLPRSARKHIRREKARIRREFSDKNTVEEKIKEVLKKFKKEKNDH